MRLFALVLVIASSFCSTLPIVAAQSRGPTVPPETGVPAPKLQLPEAALTAASEAMIEASYRAPIVDGSGNIRYIIDLTDDAASPYVGKAAPTDRLPSYAKAEMRNLAKDYGTRYGFEPWTVTSWAGNSIVAYLSPSQVEALKRDPKVTLLTQDHHIRPSAVWSDSTGPQGQHFSWGATATGVQTATATSTRVYVLDAGVGNHNNLPSVTTRVAALTGMYVYGCYEHANHVAGIVAGVGTTLNSNRGVFTSVPITSVAVGDTPNHQQQCNTGTPASGFNQGLDYIKAQVTAAGKVAIVNISSNDTFFPLGQSVGNKMLSVATPVGSYKGVLIVQSAGNKNESACDKAYSGTNVADGILVVGAIDRFGQRVQPINTIWGFRNTNYEPGSSWGSCVELWAPGNWIWSSYGTPASYQYLSGTSMAAPHVAGFAAYLASGLTNPTSVQVETAVRAASFALGSMDPPYPIKIVNSTGAAPVAQPTVEFLIKGDQVNGNVTFPASESTSLRYQAIGAQSCNLSATMNGAYWYSIANFQTEYDWYSFTLPAGTYTWSVDCVSAQGTHSTASASATVTTPPSVPVVTWYINDQAKTNQTVQIGPNTYFKLNYSAAGATACQLTATSGTPLAPWYTNNSMPSAYSWGSILMPANTYRWSVTCTGPGGSGSGYVQAVVQ